jgi:hypothetical protein
MTTRTVQAESVEYIELAVSAPTDPTAGAIAVGYTAADDEEAPAVWEAATWQGTRVALIDGKHRNGYVIRTLVGSGTADLEEGEYRVWLRITAGAEVIVRRLDDDLLVVA